jgi:ubiquinol-cytochrome c reductase core subunit 2
VLPAVNSESTAATQSASIHALELAHALAFRNGLGHSLYADSHATGKITAEDVRDLHARVVSNPSDVAILGTGISTESLAKLFETAFSAHKASAATPTPSAVPAPATAYHGSTTRVASAAWPTGSFHRLWQHRVCFGTRIARARRTPESCTGAQMGWQFGARRVRDTGGHQCARSVLLPYSDATLIGVVLEGKDGAALKEGAKAVVGAFKDAAAGKVGKEELARAVARAKFQLAAGIEAREGYVGAFGPKVLKGETASVQGTLDGIQAVSGTSLSQVRFPMLSTKNIILFFAGCG